MFRRNKSNKKTEKMSVGRKGKMSVGRKGKMSVGRKGKILAKRDKAFSDAGWTKKNTGVSTTYTRPISSEVYETLRTIREIRKKFGHP